MIGRDCRHTGADVGLGGAVPKHKRAIKVHVPQHDLAQRLEAVFCRFEACEEVKEGRLMADGAPEGHSQSCKRTPVPKCAAVHPHFGFVFATTDC